MTSPSARPHTGTLIRTLNSFATGDPLLSKASLTGCMTATETRKTATTASISWMHS
ncbi:MAG TPA: hypothetical protein VLX56_02720 [Nitrososphaerales archaeon]|nr:hypothetical protein [Nitrososphaerales archaeon]